MANFCYACKSDEGLSSIKVRLTDVVQIGLWGGGPSGEELQIVVQGPQIVRLEFPAELKSFPVAWLRVFEIMGVGSGQTTLVATVPSTGAAYTAPLQVTVGGQTLDIDPDSGAECFYHGTTLDQAKELMTIDLAPQAVPEAQLLEWYEYTDFGKGFYTWPEESKQKAVEWAKRQSKRVNKEWGVVRFTLTAQEINDIRRSPWPLHFNDKFKTRPSNSPKLFGGQPALWIEFVEYNRHIRTSSIQRPKDNDWTADYSWMRGPVWGPRDSNLPGNPGLPELRQQIDWGVSGLRGLNATPAKRRRFLFSKRNEGSL